MKIIIIVLAFFLGASTIPAQQTIELKQVSGKIGENAYIIPGKRSVTIIDALRSGERALELIQHVKAIGKPLKQIFITHGHPDHFQGLAVLLNAFPKARVFVGTAEIKADIIRYTQYAAANGLMDDEPAMQPRSENNKSGFDYEGIIQVLDNDQLRIEDDFSMQVINLLEAAESGHCSMLYHKAAHILITGDVVVNQVFPWLGPPTGPAQLEAWIRQLNGLKQDYAMVELKLYPGHGAPGAATIIDENIHYLQSFPVLLSRTTSEADAFELFKSMYPHYKGDFLLKRSIANWFPKTREKKLISITNKVDLTHTLSDSFPYIPVPGITFPFRSESIASIEKMGVGANKWIIHEHLGTQIDAPNHFIQDGMALEELAVEDLIVPVVVIDISEKAAKDRNAELTKEDILSWENIHGRIPDNSCVMMNSGWEKHLYEEKYIGLDDEHVKHFPGISTEAATFLVSERNISGVGVDVISFDPGYDNEYKTHKIILGAGKWALEAVANLGKIPARGAHLFVGAPKVAGGTGGITRLIAVW